MKNIEEELRELSPRLADLRKQDDGMRVPEHYFENLESEIFKNLDEIGARRKPISQPSPVGKLTAWMAGFWQPKFAIGLAAVLVLGFSAWWFFRPNSSAAVNSELAMTQISEDEIENFVLENVQQFDPGQLAPEIVEVEIPSSTDEVDDVKIENLKAADEQFLLDGMTDSELEELL